MKMDRLAFEESRIDADLDYPWLLDLELFRLVELNESSVGIFKTLPQPFDRQLAHSEIRESASDCRCGMSVLPLGWIVGPGEYGELPLIPRVLAVQEVQ